MLTELRVFIFMNKLVLVLKKIESDDKREHEKSRNNSTQEQKQLSTKMVITNVGLS